MKEFDIIHKRSSQPNKLPSPDILKYGELAINYAASGETICLKNSNNEIVKFISENAVQKIIDDKLNEMSLVISAALNDLNERVLDLERKIQLNE